MMNTKELESYLKRVADAIEIGAELQRTKGKLEAVEKENEWLRSIVKNFNSLPNGSNLFVMGSCPHEFIAPTTLTTPYPQRRCWKCGQEEVGNLR